MPELTVADLRARIVRLNDLSMGLMKELAIIRPGRDPLYRNERMAYLDALHRTIEGLESARVELAKACQRLGGT